MKDPFERYKSFKDELCSAVLSDVLDTNGWMNQALPAAITAVDITSKVFGRVRTLDMHPVSHVPTAPYALEMQAIDDLRPDDVLVIRMGGCPECAVWGELLSTACMARGAVGAVMDGPTRDTERILELGFPTFAIGTSPLDSKGRIDGVARDVPVRIGQTVCHHGDYLYGDRDGLVVIPKDHADIILEAALTKVRQETDVRQQLAQGVPVQEVFAKYGIL